MCYSIKLICKALLVPVLLLASSAVSAQSTPVFRLNQQEINPEKGVELSDYQQLESVALSFVQPNSKVTYDSLVLYLARGNTPVVQQVLVLESGEGADIGSVIRQARSGDRIVLEIFQKAAKEAKYFVTALN
ncbi:hypothetical protein D770_07140 [Flammeovirgaceae bacterium 311]|nr:hypothetical protein D770_07140 [Flammeovirgaceae bacterium 311]